MPEIDKPESATAMQNQHAKPGFSLISNEKLLELYATMVKCRLLDERARALLKRSGMASDGFPSGREAAIAGVALDLIAEDTIAASQNELSLGFIRGAPLEKLLGRFDARAARKRNGRRHSAHAVLPALNVIASTPSGGGRFGVAAGVALANGIAKNGRIAVAFSLERPNLTEEQRDAVRFAGGRKLPIVFVCETELGDGTEPRAGYSGIEDVVATAQENGIPEIAVDGNDAVAVYRVAHEAVLRARQGRGPTLIECKMVRMRDNPKSKDPVLNLEWYLSRKGLMRDELCSRIVAEFTQQLDAVTGAGTRAREAVRRVHGRQRGD
jgi:TPP-dependent pyruvate/acetoin dehydrogenase alpha subunit